MSRPPRVSIVNPAALATAPSSDAAAAGGGGGDGGGTTSFVELDKRLLWFEARIAAAFHNIHSTTSASILSTKYASDIRKIFEDDDVRRDVTSFCESDATRLLIAFVGTSPTGGMLVRLTAGLGDPEMHKAPKLLCFRKLVHTLKSPIVAAGAATSSSSSATAAGAGGPGGGATAGAAAGSTSATTAGGIHKVTHDNIHRIVSFFECKPHMLRCITHLIGDVVVPLANATVATSTGASVAAASSTFDGSARLSVSVQHGGRSDAAAAGVDTSGMSGAGDLVGGLSIPAWGMHATRPSCPVPVRQSIEHELETVCQTALVASGMVEGRTQLPGLSAAPHRDPSSPVREPSSGGTTDLELATSTVAQQRASDSAASARRESAVSFDSSSGSFQVVAQTMSLASAEHLAGLWSHQLRATAANTTPLGQADKQSMASGAVFRFAPIPPFEEIAYWTGRAQDLDHLVAQTNSNTFRNVLQTLEDNASRYYDTLHAARLEVLDQHREARIVLRWLTPLLPFFEAISLQSQTHYELAAILREDLFVKLFHLFYVLWAQCPATTYPTCSRLASVVAGLCEYVVTHIVHYLGLEMYFLSDPQETGRRIKVAFDVSANFKNAFFQFKLKVSRVTHPAELAEVKGEWRANTQQLFGHMDRFLERCNDVLEVLELRQLLEALGQLSISTVEAETLRTTVIGVNDRFQQALIAFSRDALEHMDQPSDAFDTMMRQGLLQVAKDVMQRLGAEILNDATNAPFSANLIRRAHALMPTLQHPYMRQHGFLGHVTSILWSRWGAEIRCVQTIHVENNYHSFLSPHVPAATKSLVFSLAVFRRLYELQVVVRALINEPYIDQDNEALQEALLIYNATCQRVGATFEHVVRTWSASLGDVISRLNAPLLQRHAMSRRYYCALDHIVTDALRDVAMIVAVMSQPLVKELVFAHLTIPAAAYEILQLKTPLWRRFTVLHSTIETYYDHLKVMQPHERGLVEFEVSTVEMLCKKGLDLHTWEDDGATIDAYNEELFAAVQAVGELLSMLRAPVEQVDRVFVALDEFESSFLPLQTSHIGDRTMSLPDFIARYEELSTGGKRRSILSDALQHQHNIASSVLTAVNRFKRANRAPCVDYSGASFRNYYAHSVNNFWMRLNEFASHALENLARQLDAAWLANNGGMPLIDGSLVVATSAAASASAPAATSLRVDEEDVAIAVGRRRGGSSVVGGGNQQATPRGGTNSVAWGPSGGATATTAAAAAVCITPDIKTELRPVMQRIVDDYLHVMQQTIRLVSRPHQRLGDDTNVRGDAKDHDSGGDGIAATTVSHEGVPQIPRIEIDGDCDGTRIAEEDGGGADAELRQWEQNVVGNMSFSVDPNVTTNLRRVEALLVEAVAQGATLTHPLRVFEQLWSPTAAASMKARLASATNNKIYGWTIDDVRHEMQRLRELSERVATDIPHAKMVCAGWLQVDVRSFKHTLSTQHSNLQQLLLDYVRDVTQNTIDDVEDYVHDSMAKIDAAGPLLDSSEQRHAALRDFFGMLRTIRQRFADDSDMFVSLSQGLRLLTTFEHLPRQELSWLSERLEALQPTWEALYQRSLSVRSQLASVQDAETQSMRQNGVVLHNKLQKFYERVKSGPIFSPPTLETLDDGSLATDVVWDPTATGGGGGDDGSSSNADDSGEEDDMTAYEGSLTVVAMADVVANSGITLVTSDMYAVLDAAMATVAAQGVAVGQFQDLLELFEVTSTTKFDLVDEAKNDLMLVKTIWDVTIHVNHHVALWMQTPFAQVDGAALAEECRRFSTAYGSMPSRVRDWKVFLMAEKRATNLMESLPLIHDLRSDALRPRHWVDLSVTALGTVGDDVDESMSTGGGGGVEGYFAELDAQQQRPRQEEQPFAVDDHPLTDAPFSTQALPVPSIYKQKQPSHRGGMAPPPLAALDPTNPSFTLGTLMRLNLHEHSAFVRKLVERAEKELVVERCLARIAAYWEHAILPFASAQESILQAQIAQAKRRDAIVATPSPLKAPSRRPATVVLGALDDVVEVLDEHLNALQNMLNSRWADVFRRLAQAWQQDLQYVESVLSCWVDVQKSLLSLFPIFARSEDLRATMVKEVRAFDAASGLFFTLCHTLHSGCGGGAIAAQQKPTPAVNLLCLTTLDVASEVIDTIAEVTPPPTVSPGSLAGSPVTSRVLAFDSAAVFASGDAVKSLRVLTALEMIQEVVSVCEKRLGGFLESKRRRFPRFYFLSDVDLIDILSKEHHPPSVCLHINQLMVAVDRVEFDVGNEGEAPPSHLSEAADADATEYRIVALHSVEGEYLPLPTGGVACSNRPVELWLDDLLVMAQVAVRDAISNANVSYVETPRPEWMFKHVAQAVLVVARAHWTSETTAALEQVENGSLSAMGDHASHLRSQLSRTIDCILVPDMTPVERKGLISLITIDVHGRDVVLDLLHKKVDSPLTFAWQAQLRFYFHNEQEELRRKREAALAQSSGNRSARRKSRAPSAVSGGGVSPLEAPPAGASFGDVPPGLRSPAAFDLASTHAVDRCTINICDTVFTHGLDYTGNCGNLVITPLTDRCYITMTQALRLCKGGAPAGPAGTGKTETVKDIAHALGVAVYVFNCSDQMDVLTVANTFKGLAMSGAWGCFDEFNRIAVEVLSVVAAQVKVLFDAKRKNALTFQLLSSGEGVVGDTTMDLPFVSTVGVFITMNPGYKGRTVLPENIKALFRPCAMVVPDVNNIAEIMLCAEGFKESKELAQKFVRLYELNQDVLSPEPHYDWGLRAIRAVLLLAGQLKRQQPHHEEKSLLLRALRDANTAKLTTVDLHMFDRLLTALFPNVEATVKRNVVLETAIADAMGEQGYLCGTDRIVPRKVLQFNDVLSVRHSIFIMGATGTGKSSLLQIAKAAFEDVAGGRRVHTETFDPKALSATEMYGSVHPYSREWRDGVLSRAFRDFATNHSRYQKSLAQWIVLDGSIDAVWIESMNSVMDDNKLLTLVNNERIAMTSSMRLIFEIANLDHATPATVSRAGILYLNRGDVGWIPMKDRWMLFQAEKVRTVLDPIFDKSFEKFLQFVIINSGTHIPLNPIAHLRSVCNLLEGVLARDEFEDMGTISAPHNYERVFLWVCVWAFGLTLPPASGSTDFRTVFSSFVKREFSSVLKLPDGATVFDVDLRMNVHTREVEWVPWRRLWHIPEFSANASPPSTTLLGGVQGAPSSVASTALTPNSGGADDDLAYMLEDKSKVTEELSLLITGSRHLIDAKAVEGLNPFSRFSVYTPLSKRFVPLPESSAHIKLLSILTQSEAQVLLVGEAGSGKTALSRFFTHRVLPLLSAQAAAPTDDAHRAVTTSFNVVEGGDTLSPGKPTPSGSGTFAPPAAAATYETPALLSYASEEITMHAQSDSAWLQARIDRLLEKRSGRQYAPANGKQLLLVLENVNLPAPDAYGSQSAHSLLRQFLEYRYWYDRARLTTRHIRNVQLMATINPSSGPQEVTERLSHKFFAFGMFTPSSVSMQLILKTLVSQSLVFGQGVSAQLLNAVHAAVDGVAPLLEQTSKLFRPAVDSFHYHFTLRDVLRFAQGLVTIGKDTLEAHIPSIWVYEAMSVFGDRLVTPQERERFSNLVFGLGRSVFNAAVGLDALMGDRAALPIFAPFVNVVERPDGTFDALTPYAKLASHDHLMTVMKSHMRAAATSTKFVLFDDALTNVCRLSRTLSHPGGHAVVVGVSGSGKRSLVKLAAELTRFQVYQRDPSSSSSTTTSLSGATLDGGGSGGGTTQIAAGNEQIGADVKQEFARIVHASAVKNLRQCIVLSQTDLEHWGVRQFVDEYLSTSYVADLFTGDEKNEVLGRMAQELRSMGEPRYMDTTLCQDRLKEKLSNNLRIVCCLSPFLKTLKPLLRSCTGFLEAQMVYFHEWPLLALMKVAERIVFDPSRGGIPIVHPGGGGSNEASNGGVGSHHHNHLTNTSIASASASSVAPAPSPPVRTDDNNSDVGAGDLEEPDHEDDGDDVFCNTPQFADGVCKFLASTHRMGLATAHHMRHTEHREVYVTPKTFLTFCQQALKQVKTRRQDLLTRRTRLRVGLDRLRQCGTRVASLQIELGDYKKAVQQQATVASMLFARVRSERNVVEDQNQVAKAENERTQKIVDEVNALVAECEADIAAAQPIVDAARAALNTLNRPNLTELKAMHNPPEPVHAVTACVMCILTPSGSRVPQDRSWAASRRMMADVPRWMKTLEELDVNHLYDPAIAAVESTVKHAWFNPVDIVRVSFAASSLCAWVVNVVKYHHIRVMLRPKEARLAEAQQRLASSQAQARRVEDRCNALQARLDGLVSQCDAAEAERNRLDALLTHTEAKLQRAHRLIASLADEKIRWAEGLEAVAEDRQYLDGDSLLGAAFSTYCGSLPASSRERLVAAWQRDLDTIGCPSSEDANIVRILFGASEGAVWRNEGLASATFLEQNAAITLAESIRWPMTIDPQHQALRWLRGRAAARGQTCTVLSPSDPDLALRAVECVTRGHLTIVELSAPYEVPPLLLALVEKRFQEKVFKRRSASMVGSTVARRRSLSPATSPPDASIDPPATATATGESLSQLVPVTSSTSFRHLGGSQKIVHTVDIGPDHEAIVHDDFFLVLRCVVSNPALRPDLFAQSTVIDYCVTEGALTEQLLSIVVTLEQPELEKTRLALTAKMNRMTVALRDYESLLLNELSTATGDVLENESLILTLEEAKRQSVELAKSLAAAEETRIALNHALGVYEPIALRGCLMYMAVTHLSVVDPMYHYSMDLFVAQFQRTVALKTTDLDRRHAAYMERVQAMTTSPSAGGAAGSPSRVAQRQKQRALHGGGKASSSGGMGSSASDVTPEDRIKELLAVVAKDLFLFVDRSLFAEHKLVYAMTVALTVMQRVGEADPALVAFFVRGSKRVFGEPPKHVADWLSKTQWEQLHRLADLDGVVPPFRTLIDECLETTRWKLWCELPRPEGDKLPGDWKSCTPLQRLLIVRALRPDRLIAACRNFLQETFLSTCMSGGAEEVPLTSILDQLPNCNPVMFLQTPGSDPEGQCLDAAAACGMEGHLTILSMGQSQERRAKEATDRARERGTWVFLHNVHLMRAWLPFLDAYVQAMVVNPTERTHPKFRLFLSCEPVDHIPSGLLQNAIKIVNEPPSGLRCNVLRAYQTFSDEPWEHSTKPHEFHIALFSLCYFHSVAVERSKFGPVGWNSHYPFNTEDLRVCVDVLATYLEDRPRVPWEDLRYMFGEIMYGGHITEHWDRRLCMTYLSQYISADIMERAEVAPGIPFPRSRNHADTKAYISELFPEESPTLYQLNAVSESRVRYREGRTLVAHLLDTVQVMSSATRPQPSLSRATSSRTLGGNSEASGGGAAPAGLIDDERIDDISLLLGALPEPIALDEVAERLGEDRSPFHHVFFQECERMNRLVTTMQRTLDAAEAAVRGTQAMSSDIDSFLSDVACDRIPTKWAMHWGATKRPLAAWLQIVGEASKQLNRWAMDLMVPKLVNLSCLFIPVAFFGAVLQDASLRVGEALDNMGLVVEVTKRMPHQVDLHAREGVYVTGPSLEGAAWDPLTQCLQEATLRDGLPMPVMILRATSLAKIDRSDSYACPLYKTTDRGATYVAALHLRTKLPSSTWVVRGTALILDAMF